MTSRNIVMLFLLALAGHLQAQQKPNVLIIYADDLGYGDLGCYGATKIKTPNLDALAARGIRFTNAHTAAATCTPSRYALMTGQYAWRKKGTGVLPGDASLIIPTNGTALPAIFKTAGYTTGIVGKWHLGLGNAVEKNWNQKVSPGPNETGFDYSFIFPATADRVPTVFLENGSVCNAEDADPLEVNYQHKIGNEPTGKEQPELLKMKASEGHNNTIVNGIGRIGWMTGGHKARWVDEELSFTFLAKAQSFIDRTISSPFFLYFALTEPHVPRMPASMFKGKSGLGYRGDAILQIDWTVGEIIKTLKATGKYNNTLIIFSSDNGPVLDDGYEDEAVTRLNGHTPAGPFRGGKYSAFEGGTRVPFIVTWPVRIKPGVSDALIGQVDFCASFAALLQQKQNSTDSKNVLNALLSSSQKGRDILIEQASALALVQGNWKYIRPHGGPAVQLSTNTETGNAPQPQLYNLITDPGEKNNLAGQYPEKVAAMEKLLAAEENRNP